MDEGIRGDMAAALLIERLVRDAYSDRAPGSVTPLQWAILRTVKRARPDNCSQNWIARFVGVTAAPANRAIKALQRHGAVTISRDHNDSRKTIISLTAEGEVMLQDDPIHSITRKLAKLDAHKKVEFRNILQQLLLVTDDDEHDRAAGIDSR